MVDRGVASLVDVPWRVSLGGITMTGDTAQAELLLYHNRRFWVTNGEESEAFSCVPLSDIDGLKSFSSLVISIENLP